MILYIALFTFLFSLLVFDSNANKVKGLDLKKAVFALIFLFSALRFDVGWDYERYYKLIEKNIKFYDSQFERFEFFNRVLINISQYLDFTQLYFIITSFIIAFSFYKVFKKYSADFAISTLLFLSLPIFFFNSLSIIRQFVAVSIIFYGFTFIRNRNFFKFLVTVVVASMFHKSAIIGLVLYFLYNRRGHVYFFLVIYVLGFFSSDLIYWLVEHVLPQYLKFLDKSIGEGGNKVLLLFQIIGFFILFLIHKLKMNTKDNSFYFLAFYIGLFIWSSLAKYGHAGFRGSLYFTVFLLLLLPNIMAEIKQKRFVVQITYVMCFMFFSFTLMLGKLNPKKDPNIPYRTFLLNDGEFKKIE